MTCPRKIDYCHENAKSNAPFKDLVAFLRVFKAVFQPMPMSLFLSLLVCSNPSKEFV